MHLGDEVRIGPRVMRNRTMQVAVNTGFAGDHHVGEQLRAFYRRRSLGGVGAIVSGLSPVHPSSVYKSSVMKNTDDADLPDLERFAQAVAEGGALSLMQLVHNGSQMVPGPGGPQPVSPSGVPTPGLGQTSTALSTDAIRELIQAFAQAALRARDAGLDGVEVHGAHGFLIHQFLSPLTNLRTDAYGGSRSARMRFAIEVLQAVRDKVGTDIVVGFRMVADEFASGGITEADALETATRLVELGLVDYLSVSAGNYGTLERGISPLLYPDAPLAQMCGRIRAAVNVPVVVCNRITLPEHAQAVLEAGQADIVGVGRALLADPDWAHHAIEGLTSSIRPCIGTNHCFAGGGVTTSAGIGCSVNPELGLVEPPVGSRPAAAGPEILVVGAGVAGLAFALEASRMGARIRIVDKSAQAGGQVLGYDDALTRGRFGRYVDYALTTLADRGIKIEFNTEIIRGDLVGRTQHVVLATGSRDGSADVGSNVISAWDALQLPEPLGGRVVLRAYDGSPFALQLAEYLSRSASELHVVSADQVLSPAVEGLTRRALTASLDQAGSVLHMGSSMDRVSDAKVELRDVQTGAVTTIDMVDAFVVDSPRIADRWPGATVHSIGDCVVPADIATATAQAHALARLVLAGMVEPS
jgi:2,4-dienoyl-CoA reductase-like NADH-dependent reductase (Old Yellow Enzyme family)